MIPQFDSKEERLEWVKQNKQLLIRTKKSAIKQGDATYGINIAPSLEHASEVAKELGVANLPVSGVLQAKLIINTTNLLDSHHDVHIPGLWKKTLSEAKDFLHLQEHRTQFDKVISDDAKAFTKKISWKSLGYDFEGSTEALVFDSTITETRNPFMYDQYAKGYVRNHSVGMQYVNMFMCINSEEKWSAEEKESWDKYYPMIANKQAADDLGYFFAITEAKLIEGSAVLRGSNYATPILEITEAGKSTSENIEPEQSTQIKRSRFASIGSKIKN